MEPAAPSDPTASPESSIWRGIPSWEFARHGFRARFLGRGSPPRDAGLASWLAPEADAASWLRQCHSATVLDARPGPVGDGDALVVRERGLAAVVATADCVPVVVIGAGVAAVIHAGWRGIVAGIVPRALEALGERESIAEARAWIGPAIGPCCYEVGEEVAAAVTAAIPEGTERVRVSGRGVRPHLDLRRVVAAQLAASGVSAVKIVERCTRCRPDLLASYRRDGERAGRNLTILWRERGTSPASG